MSEVMNKK